MHSHAHMDTSNLFLSQCFSIFSPLFLLPLLSAPCFSNTPSSHRVSAHTQATYLSLSAVMASVMDPQHLPHFLSPASPSLFHVSSACFFTSYPSLLSLPVSLHLHLSLHTKSCSLSPPLFSLFIDLPLLPSPSFPVPSIPPLVFLRVHAPLFRSHYSISWV